MFPKAFIDDVLKDAPGGVCILLQATIKEIPLIAVSYCYSTRTTLFLVATKDLGLTHPGSPYEMKYTDNFGNVCICKVERPDINSKFFEASNTIDKHNQQGQSDMALKKCWLTNDPWFHVYTTLIGINVVNCYNKLADYHKIINFYLSDKAKKLSIEMFAGYLSTS